MSWKTGSIVWLSILLELTNLLWALSGVNEFAVAGQATLTNIFKAFFLIVIIALNNGATR
jgi:hypothetical protein